MPGKCGVILVDAMNVHSYMGAHTHTHTYTHTHTHTHTHKNTHTAQSQCSTHAPSCVLCGVVLEVAEVVQGTSEEGTHCIELHQSQVVYLHRHQKQDHPSPHSGTSLVSPLHHSRGETMAAPWHDGSTNVSASELWQLYLNRLRETSQTDSPSTWLSDPLIQVGLKLSVGIIPPASWTSKHN